MSDLYSATEFLAVGKEIIGKNGNKVTFEELITKLNDLVDDLIEKTGRSYCFEGFEKSSDNKFIILWGS